MFGIFRSSIILPILDLIYPPVCLACASRRRERSSLICVECWGSLTPVGPGHPVWREIWSRFDAEGCVSALASCFLFEKAGKMQDIVHLLKYRGMMSIGVELGRMLGQKILDEGRFDPSSVLAPVPLHRLKRRERGFNQSELICRGVSAITGMPLRNDLLIRRSNTRSQTKLTLEERKENVKNAFEVNEKKRKAVRDADIILVDDVITTGSTIEAGAKTLLTAGAARVFAASIALAEQKNSSKTGGLFFTPVLGTF